MCNFGFYTYNGENLSLYTNAGVKGSGVNISFYALKVWNLTSFTSTSVKI
jgi:hypothetical protein